MAEWTSVRICGARLVIHQNLLAAARGQHELIAAHEGRTFLPGNLLVCLLNRTSAGCYICIAC